MECHARMHMHCQKVERLWHHEYLKKVKLSKVFITSKKKLQ